MATALAEVGLNGRHAAIRNGGTTIVEELLAPVIPDLTERLIAAHPGRVYREAARLLERAVLQYVLDVTGGNQLQAARLLGMNRNTPRKRCRQFTLELRRTRP